jgi:hypothetical protein
MIFVRRTFGVPDWQEWAGKLAGGDFQITVLYPTPFMHIGQIGNPTYAAARTTTICTTSF